MEKYEKVCSTSDMAQTNKDNYANFRIHVFVVLVLFLV